MKLPLLSRVIIPPVWMFMLAVLASRAQAEVQTLTMSDFYPTIQGEPHKWFVKFYAEWCGHCKRLRPIWKQVSESLDGSVGVVKVDATKNRDLADKFGVQGYPTLVYIHDDNKYYKFSGGSRALEDLVAFAREGYKKVEGKPLPPPPGWEDILKSYQKRLKKEYLMLEEDFYHIMELRKNAMVAFLVIGGVVGSFVGCGFGACCCRGGGRKKNKVD